MLRRFPWRLWALLSALWVGFWLFVFRSAGISVHADMLYWVIVAGPPLALVAGTLALARAFAVLREKRRRG